MNRRISGASLLYAGTAGPFGTTARWFRTAATIVDAWGSSLCARQWHASRLLTGPSAVERPLIGQLAAARVSSREVEGAGTRLV
ncbi:MAG TPA: hypothetical protein VN750_12065 [Steroidobacteraceae bacterium]|jgi:hypothetical protein|nr:hypothetical protein [Steroidobacteraceae bacterium]